MRRTIVIASLLLTAISLFSGCDSHAASQKTTAKAPKVRKAPPPVQVVDSEPVGNPLKGIWRVPIPQREHGYRNFESQIIDNDTGLRQFLEKVAKQPNWNSKDDFMSAMTAASINFKLEFLLLIRITAGSGSITISMEEPTIYGDAILFRVIRKVPGAVTCDMNYQCFAVAVPKTTASQVRIIRNTVRQFSPFGLAESNVQDTIPLNHNSSP